MTEAFTKGEMHGCIVCGKLYNLYVVYDAAGKLHRQQGDERGWA